jgi:D-2-hydroxyacid dehydrogenase (NADP+)
MLNRAAFPPRDALTVAFAHVAYCAAEEFAARQTGVAHSEVRTLEELERRAREADVLVVSGLWRNTLLASAPKLRFVRPSAPARISMTGRCSPSAAFGWPAPRANEHAVAEHAIALILALTRKLHLARDNQRARRWRDMIGDRGCGSTSLAARPY